MYVKQFNLRDERGFNGFPEKGTIFSLKCLLSKTYDILTMYYEIAKQIRFNVIYTKIKYIIKKKL